MKYEVVTPAEMHGPIARDAGTPMERDGIRYELFQAADKVVVHFVNTTQSPLTLSADSSALFDVTGRSFAVEAQTLAPQTSGQVVLPPAAPAERDRPRAIADEVRVGGYDEGGILNRDRLENRQRDAELTPGFRWPDGRVIRLRLVFEPSASATTKPATSITHEWMLRRDH